ncbi:hypothetical protein [Caldalkalibacillus thermarum]|uniref:hypothetical protein n=1 Tax=Caldalkalibacillus thermarum TaxID=296745 RepID=UPI00307A587B
MTKAKIQKDRWPLTITFSNGLIIRSSAPICFNACKSAVINAMIRKMLNNSPAAVMMALKMACSPPTRLPP